MNTNTDTIRFLTIFVIIWACFGLKVDSNILTFLYLPSNYLLVTVISLLFTAAIYKLNLLSAGIICWFLLVANATHLTHTLVTPSKELALSLALSLAALPFLADQING